MFINIFDEFETVVIDCLDYMNLREGERINDVQDIHDYYHDAYVVVQPEL
jgi:hypothetical protein